MAPNNLISGDIAPGATLQTNGEWRPEELRVVEDPQGRGMAVIYGDCLADDAAITHRLEKALSDDPAAMTDLPGSYTTLLFRPEGLTVLADLAGQYPFYYRQDADGLSFSTLTEPLCSTSGGPKLDTAVAAARVGASGVADLAAGRSTIQDVARLEGGHRLEVGSQRPASSTPYETFEQPTLGSVAEATEALRAALLEGAQHRAESSRPLSIDFSGGYDSTSAAYLIAQARGEPVPVVTFHSPDAPTDDLERARQCLALPASEGLFDPHEFVRPGAATFYGDLLALPPGDEPDKQTIRASGEAAYMEFLRGLGSELHITGAGADGIVDMEPSQYLGGLARLSTLHRFLQGVREAARAGLASPLDILRDVRRNRRLDPGTSLRLISAILEGTRDPKILQYGNHLFPGAAPQWLTPKARRELSELALARADALDIPAGYDSGNRAAYANIKAWTPSLHHSMQFVTGLGMRKRPFYMDHNILRACLGLPSHLRHDPRTFKMLLAKALQGLVPPEVTSRSTKGDYSRHAFAGLQAARPVLEKLLRESRLVELGIIDPKAVAQSLESIYMGGKPPWVALEDFIALELWLRRHDTAASPGGAPVSMATSPKPPEEKLSEPPQEKLEEPLPPDATFSMSPGVSMVTRSHGALLVNIASNRYHRVNVPGCEVMQALSATGSLGEAVAQLQAAHPDVDPDQVCANTSRMVRWLLSKGLLVEGSGVFSIVQGSEPERIGKLLPVNMTRQEQQHIRTRLRDYPAAIGGFLLAVMLGRRPLQTQLRALARIHERWARRPIAPAEAENLLAAVQRVSAVHLGRTACLEHSMATVLGAALRRRKLDLVLGFKTNPDELHVWPQADEAPIRTANDPEIAGIFEPILKA